MEGSGVVIGLDNRSISLSATSAVVTNGQTDRQIHKQTRPFIVINSSSHFIDPSEVVFLSRIDQSPSY